MNNTILLIALAGLTSAASAQEFSLSLVGAPATIDSTGGATFTMTLIGDASVGQFYLGGAISLESSSDLISDITWENASWSAFNTDGGYAGGGNYNQVIYGTLFGCGAPPPFCKPVEESRLGQSIGVFTVYLAANTVGQIGFDIIEGDPFSLEVGNWDTGQVWNSSQGQLTLNGASINVVPAPSSLALLGLGGLAASRRRR